MYELRPFVSDGYSVTGTITTNGAIGFFASSDVVSWSWSATNGTTTFGGTEPVDVGVGAFNGLSTATDLYIQFPAFPGDILFSLNFNTGPGQANNLIYAAGTQNLTLSSYVTSGIIRSDENAVASFTNFYTVNGPATPAPFAFASTNGFATPEPSSLACWGLGFAASALLRPAFRRARAGHRR